MRGWPPFLLSETGLSTLSDELDLVENISKGMSRLVANPLQAYDKGKVLFVPGDLASSVYLVLEGMVIASQGDENVVLGPGAILGDLAFFQEREHFYAAVCATNVTAMEMTKDNIKEVFEKQPLIACSLLRELAITATKIGEMHFVQGVEQLDKEQARSGDHLLPEGHPVFTERVPASHNEFLFNTDVSCPICHTKFAGVRTRVSRLQAAEHRPDFRAVYRNFEPNFYYIWVCPNCLFAYPERQYGRISQGAIRRGQAHLEEHPPQTSFVFDGQRTLDQVITSYYLALDTFEVVRATPEQWANLWLRLMWIYEDLGEEARAKDAAEEASKYFAESMSATARSAAGDQQLYIIMGELNLRLGKGGDAFRNFHSAATMIGGDPRYKRMATDRIQDLREAREG